MKPSVVLKSPSLELVRSYLEFIEEMRVKGETIWGESTPDPDETHAGFVERLLRSETTPRHGLVPHSTYWAVAENEVVGKISLRHYLNEKLSEFGGHIGYEVRPSRRKRGIAKEMLRQVLLTPKALAIGRLLVTCAPDNVASNKTILANGGKLEKTAFVPSQKRETNYYWIEIRDHDLTKP